MGDNGDPPSAFPSPTYDGCCSVLEIMGVRLSPRTTSTTLGVRYLGVNTQLGTVQVQGYEFRKVELPQKSLPK